MLAARAASSSGSLSSARSHTASWPSPEVVASTEDSKGHHSTDVTGPLQATPDRSIKNTHPHIRTQNGSVFFDSTRCQLQSSHDRPIIALSSPAPLN